jgi:hypothetical protein
MKPIALSDDQLSQILRCAAPLTPADRSDFLRDVAQALNGQELGDGLILRTCREIQKRYWRAPEMANSGKYR